MTSVSFNRDWYLPNGPAIGAVYLQNALPVVVATTAIAVLH
jgi:hypothetical protein